MNRRHWAEPARWVLAATEEGATSGGVMNAPGNAREAPVRVFVADDNEIFMLGITHLIGSQPGFAVVGRSTSAAGAAAGVTAVEPDVVIMEAQLPDGRGTDLCGAITSACPRTRCLIFTDDERAETIAAAIAAGASGYVLKRAHGRTFLDSVLRVSRGELLPLPPVPASSSSGPRDFALTEPDLTFRELQVLELISHGLTNRQIGESLFLAEKTVKNYVSGLLSKLGFERRTQAAVYGAARRSA